MNCKIESFVDKDRKEGPVKTNIKNWNEKNMLKL